MNVNNKIFIIGSTGYLGKSIKEYFLSIGSKNKVISQLGLVYNDLHSDVWMYRISYKTRLFRKNFLYIYFNKNKVDHFELRRFKFS